MHSQWAILQTALLYLPTLSWAQASVPPDLSTSFDPNNIALQVNYNNQAEFGFQDGTVFTPQRKWNRSLLWPLLTIGFRSIYDACFCAWRCLGHQYSNPIRCSYDWYHIRWSSTSFPANRLRIGRKRDRNCILRETSSTLCSSRYARRDWN